MSFIILLVNSKTIDTIDFVFCYGGADKGSVTAAAFYLWFEHKPSVSSCQAFLSFVINCSYLYILPILLISTSDFLHVFLGA